MSVIKTEVEETLKHFKPSKAVYRIGNSYGNSLQFSKMYRPTSEVSTFITECLMGSGGGQVSEYLNMIERKHILSERNAQDIAENIRWEVCRFFPSFVNKYNDSKNNKLTTLYRWFNGAIGTHTLREHADLEKDLWAIYKWLKTEKNHSQNNPTTQNAIKLLEIIRQRYEPKGIKV